MRKNRFFIAIIFVFNFFTNNCLACTASGEPCSILVDKSCQICVEEKAFVDSRAASVSAATKKLVGKDEKNDTSIVPKIAFCFSGGGYRAMIACLGFMLGAKEIGLNDATTYVASLSGSCWFVANFLLRMKKFRAKLETFRDFLQKKVEKSFLDPSTFDFSEIIDRVWKVFVDRGKVEPADLYGAILADKLWGDIALGQEMTFSDLTSLFEVGVKNVETTKFPFPIFTLVLSDSFPYEWLEVNPFVAGSDYLQGYIPTLAFDSYFEKGRCKELFPEQTLGWYLGMFGSAYNFSLGDIFVFLAKEYNESSFLKLVMNLVDQYSLHERRMMPSPVHNFIWKMNYNPLASRKDIEISDAGMAFGIPLPPLLKEGRNADVIVVCDSSTNAAEKGYRELFYAKAYMNRKKIKFPSLENPKKIFDNLFIFEDENDKTVPTIIYVINPYSVPNRIFTYSKERFDKLCDSVKDVVVRGKDAIVEAIKNKMELLNGTN
jgi:phospholipase A2